MILNKLARIILLPGTNTKVDRKLRNVQCPVCFQQPFGAFGVCCKGTLVVTFGFLPQDFGRWCGLMNGILSLSGEDTGRKWHSKPSCCNQICLHFLHSQVVGALKHYSHTRLNLNLFVLSFFSQTGIDIGLH